MDTGPYSLTGTTYSASFVPGYRTDAVLVNESAYFQVADITCLGYSNQAFSIAFWVQPISLTGTIVLATSHPTVGSSFYCYPYIGFNTNGELTVQVNSGGANPIYAPSLLALSPTWSHVVQTWSLTNGLRLYVNNVLVASNSSLNHARGVNDVSYYVTLGRLANANVCWGHSIDLFNSFTGVIDDLRIYNRELSAVDICTIYNS